MVSRQHRALDWRICVLVGAMVATAVLDLVFPSVDLLAFLVIPIAASVMIGGPRLTAGLAAVALALMLLDGIVHADFAAPDGWLQLLALTVASVVAVVVAAAVDGRRRRLEDSEGELRLLAENASDVVVLLGRDKDIQWISPSVTTLLGWTSGDLVGTQPSHLMHPDDVGAVESPLAQDLVAGQQPPSGEARFRRADGSYVWLLATSKATPDGQTVASFRLVDDEVRSRAALSESEAKFRLLAENSMDLVFSLDTKATIQWVSPSATRMLNYDPEELVGQFGAMLLHSDDLPTLLDAAAQAREGQSSSCRVRMVTKDDRELWVEAIPRGLYDDAGVLVGGVIGVRDIDEEVRTQQALDREIEYDALTDVAKRSLAVVRIQEMLDTRQSSWWALLCVGIDGLTLINQAYGYASGDEVLRAVSRRLAEVGGAHDRVARVGGDEFAVLLPDIASPSDAAVQAERIRNAVRGPLTVGAVTIDVTACVGVAPAGHQDAEALLRDATAAMRQASRRGRDRWEFLNGNVSTETRQMLETNQALGVALSLGQVEAWFMPIVRLTDGVVIANEALVRWVLEDGTVRMPGEFLEVAESTGLILAIDRVVLARSLEELAHMPLEVSISVNVSAASLASADLESWVRHELVRTGADPRRLHLEVTETVLFEVTSAVRQAMKSLAGLGVSWWVDDFGTGFSSISHLRDLPITGLKLDRSFTASVMRADGHGARLAQGLAGLANGLGLLTIAEGVETPEQAKVIAGQGWQAAQGWLFGKAAPVHDDREERVEVFG